MKQLFILLSLFLATYSQAQEISGRVVDKGGQPIAFVNIVLADKDSTFIAGCTSNDNGSFSLPLSANATFLKVSFIGYQNRFLTIDKGKRELGNILLQEETYVLGDVIVKANLPQTFIKGEAMVTNIGGSVLERVGTAKDVLGEVPGVNLKNDNIYVFGRGAPEIYINEKVVHDATELTQLTSENIKSISVISNPGSRYDKSVKAVIKIQTKKKQGDGFGINNRINVNYNDKLALTNQLGLNYRWNNLDVAGMLAYSDQSHWRRYNALQKTFLEQYWEQQMRVKQNISTQQLTGNAIINYMFNTKHSIGVNYRFRRSLKTDSYLNMESNITQDDVFFEKSLSELFMSIPSTSHEVNTYYYGKLNEWEIDFNGTFLNNKNRSTLKTDEQITDMGGKEDHNTVHTSTNTQNYFYAGKLILSYPLLSGDLSFGGELTHIKRTSIYENKEGIVANDDSKIKELLSAAFIEYSHSFGNLEVLAGLRYEYVDFDYYQANIYQDMESKTYRKLFPSISATLPIQKVQLKLSYSSDIFRPTYEMLRSRVDYINRYSYETGNPFLQPSISHNITLQSSYRWLTLYANVAHLKDAIIFTSDSYSEEDPNIALFSQINAPSYNNMNVMVNASPTINKWHPQLGFEVFKQWFTTEEPGSEGGMLSLNRTSYAVRWRNSLELPWGINFSANLNWEGRADLTNKSHQSVWWMSGSVQKYFLKKKLAVLIQANDIFNTFRNKEVAYHGRLRSLDMNEKFSQRFIGISVQYRLNIPKSNYRGSGAGGSQRRRL